MFNPEEIPEPKTILRRAEMVDAPLILDLLSKNLAKNLPENERKDGLFYEPTKEEFEKIINDTGIYLCLRDTVLKGYFITMSKELAQTIPFEAEFVNIAEKMFYKDKPISEYNYVVLAQLLVEKEFRGGMTFHRLWTEIESALKIQGFELGVGEIADHNLTSRAVHAYLTDAGTYTAESGIKWHIMVKNLKAD